ncbi:MAG TPA: hypothetical protein VNO81_10260 [Candidatus Nitrosotenuis sp.]|nr:hypothetical protein [Candidatus Nitrosotenuis sp.]
MKKELPLAICFLSGLIMIAQFYMPPFEELGDKLNQWFTIIAAFAYVLGVGSLIVVNGHKIQRLAPGWGFNLVLLLSFFVTLLLGLLPLYPGHKPTDEGTAFDWIFRHVYNPLSATMFSLLAFFIASAAFRAFRAKSVEATLLLTSAFIVMIFRVPLGEMIWNSLPWLGQYDIGKIVETWLMGTFTTAGQRTIMLGAAVGLISVSLKILLGIERSYVGE